MMCRGARLKAYRIPQILQGHPVVPGFSRPFSERTSLKCFKAHLKYVVYVEFCFKKVDVRSEINSNKIF